MKLKFKRISSLFLAIVILFTSLANNTMEAFAQSSVIKNININPSEIRHGDNFTVEGYFESPKVENGQTEQIVFNGNYAGVILPGNSISLTQNGDKLGEVTFSGNVATITFNEYASTLENIQGAFNFSVQGSYNGDTSQNGTGSIDIIYGNQSQTVNVNYETGGVATEDLYYKSGVWIQNDPQGNRVDWDFTVNPARVSTNGISNGFTIYDTLPDTMTWDIDFNNSNDYVVQVFGQWKTIEQARNIGINISIVGQQLTVTIPHSVPIDSYGNYRDPLDGNEVNIRLAARVTDSVMYDTSITEVINTSSVDTGNLQWDIPEKNLTGSTKIYRSGGWISGTLPGELKVVKKLKDTEEPIEGVEFTLSKADGSNIKINQEDKGPIIKITTDQDGIAILKGLGQGSYILTETDAPEGIKYDPNNPETKTFEITPTDSEGKLFNIYNEKEELPPVPEITDITVTKEWEDYEGNIITAPVKSINVQLLKDNEKYGEEIELNENNSWTYKFENLELTDLNGQAYQYTVVELDSYGNIVEDRITLEDNTYKVNVIGSIEEGYTIKNTREFNLLPIEPAERSINVEKAWTDYTGKEITAPVDSIEVELYKDGEATGQTEILNAENGWKASFKELPTSETIESPAHEYTVKEVNEEDGRISLAGDTYKVNITGDMAEGYTITNSKEFNIVPIEPAKRSINVEKAWTDYTGKEITAPVDSIEVELYKDGEATGDIRTLSSLNNWKTSFDDLKISETINSDLYEYTVKEVNEEDGRISLAGDTYKVNITGDMAEGYTITNSKEFNIVPLEPAERSINVEKAWTDYTGKEITAPVDSIEVELYKDGEATGQTEILNAENGWKASFKELPTSETIESPAHEYTVKEVNEEDGRISLAGDTYKVNITGDMAEGYTITNSKEFNIVPIEPAERSINVEKVWTDYTGKEITAPVDSIEVELYKDGEATGDIRTLSSLNNWKTSFDDLKISETINSDLYEYTVKEVNEEDGKISLAGDTYKVNITGDMAEGYTITNSKEFNIVPLEPAERSVKVEKEWTDYTGKEITAPIDSIEVELYKDGEATGDIRTLSSLNNWKTSFDDLKISETINSDLYEYTVKEVNEKDGRISLAGDTYKVNITGDMAEGYTITNSKEFNIVPLEPAERSINVEKAWTDYTGKEITAPVDSIEVELYKDGEATGQTKILSEENGWKASFDNLKVSETLESENYEYTVVELDKDGIASENTIKLNDKMYNIKITGDMSKGFTIINSLSDEFEVETGEQNKDIFIDVSGKKIWEDNNNKEGKRPEEITIRLFANGKEIDKKIVNAKDEWKWDFGKFPKYQNEEEVKYTISEDSVKNYESKVEGYDVTNTYKESIVENIKETVKETANTISKKVAKGKAIPWTGSDPITVPYSLLLLVGLLYFVNKKFNK